MDASTLWWLLAGGVVVAELLTGTFYLLMLALGLGAAALSAHAGLSIQLQITTAAVCSALAVVAWHLVKRRRPGDPSARADRSVNLDIGETVHIGSWEPDGTAIVRYRGTSWTAMARDGTPGTTGTHRVCELIGNRLVVEPLPPTSPAPTPSAP